MYKQGEAISLLCMLTFDRFKGGRAWIPLNMQEFKSAVHFELTTNHIKHIKSVCAKMRI